MQHKVSDPYEVLGLDRSATEADVRAPYLRFHLSGIGVSGVEAGRLAQFESRSRVDVEPEALRLPAHREDARVGGDERRHAEFRPHRSYPVLVVRELHRN